MTRQVLGGLGGQGINIQRPILYSTFGGHGQRDFINEDNRQQMARQQLNAIFTINTRSRQNGLYEELQGIINEWLGE